MGCTTSSEWLKENIDHHDLILLDASMASTVDGKSSEFAQTTIKGARPFDLNVNFSDPYAPFPNTMPSPEQFEAECQKLGINSTSKIIVFDNLGVYSSPRVWWMFKAMGHEEVFVLDGGLPEWVQKGFPVEPIEKRNYDRGNFQAAFNPMCLKTYEEVIDNLESKDFTIADARSEGRFEGTAKEPRKHLKSGHISDSINIPFESVLENGKFKSPAELRELFDSKIDENTNLVYSCGSGLTACIILMAGELAGRQDMAVYDGSWTEWAERQNLKTD